MVFASPSHLPVAGGVQSALKADNGLSNLYGSLVMLLLAGRHRGFGPGSRFTRARTADISMSPAHADCWTIKDGYIPDGGNLHVADMTVEEAKLKCTQLSGCIGFTHDGPPTSSAVTIYFKSKADVDGSGWTSYLLEKMQAKGEELRDTEINREFPRAEMEVTREIRRDVPRTEIELTRDLYVNQMSTNIQPFIKTMEKLKELSASDPIRNTTLELKDGEGTYQPLFFTVLGLFDAIGSPSHVLNLQASGPLDRWIQDQYREEVERHFASLAACSKSGRLLDMLRAWSLVVPPESMPPPYVYSPVIKYLESGKLTQNLEWFITEIFLPLTAYAQHGYFCYSYMQWVRAIGTACSADVGGSVGSGPSAFNAAFLWKITAAPSQDSKDDTDIGSKISTWQLESTLHESSPGFSELTPREKQLTIAAPSIPVKLFLDYSGHVEYALQVLRKGIAHDTHTIVGDSATPEKMFPWGFSILDATRSDLSPHRNSLLAFRSLQLLLDTDEEVWPWVIESEQAQRRFRPPKIESWAYILFGAQIVEPFWQRIVMPPDTNATERREGLDVILVAPLWNKDRHISSSAETNSRDRQSAYVPVMPISFHNLEFEILLPSTRGGKVFSGYEVLTTLRPLRAGNTIRSCANYTLRDASVEVNSFLKNGEHGGDDLRRILEEGSNRTDLRGEEWWHHNVSVYDRPKAWRGVDLDNVEQWAFNQAGHWSNPVKGADSESASVHWAQIVERCFPGMARAIGISLADHVRDYAASSRRVDETFLLLRFVAGIAVDKWVNLNTHQMSSWDKDSALIFVNDIE